MTVSYARRRSAFTLVEMLVASALIIFMMYIIAGAFEKGLGSFRVLKTQGDMQEKLRAAATTIRLDLSAPHFGDGSALSNYKLNQQDWLPPSKGYFRISLPSAVSPAAQEGIDPDGPTAAGSALAYYRLDPSTINELYLQFTANYSDGHPSMRDARGRRDQYYTTDTGSSTLNPYCTPDYNRGDPGSPNIFTSYWADITYFLRANGQFTSGGATLDGSGGTVAGLPLFTLYRRHKMLVDLPDTVTPPTLSSTSGCTDVSVWDRSGVKFTNRPSDITEPFRRFGMTPTGASSEAGVFAGLPRIQDETPLDAARMGGDVLVTDIVHFEMKVLYEPVYLSDPNATKFKQTGDAVNNFIGPALTQNPDFPFAGLPKSVNPVLTGKTIFDTWTVRNDSFATGIQPYSVNQNSPNPDTDRWNGGHFIPAGTTIPASANSLPLRVRVRGIQIKMRIWDRKSSLTRQITIIQDL